MATSTAAVSALMQKASQQYLECRRRVSAKAEEVATLDQEIQTLFERITDSSVTSAAKSVGRLELSVVAVEGDAPVDDAVISVEIEPEYEEPEAPVQEVAKAEEPKEEKTEEAAEESEKAEADEEAKEEGDEKTEEPKAEETKAEEAAVEEAAVEEEEKAEAEEAAEAEKPAAPRRSVQWSDAESFPLNVVFDPVQSREAVVTIAIAAPAKDGEESEPVKEFRIPVSSLFKTGSINRWYVLKKVEHVHIDKAAITEVDDEAEPKETSTEEPVKEDAAPEAEKTEEEAEKPATEEEAEKPATVEAEKPATEEEAEKPATEEAEKPAAEEEEKKAEESTEEDKKTEAEDDVKTMETAPELTLVAATATVESEDKVVVLKEGKLHVQVHFTMSEIEKLSQTAIALSQQKQEAEATLAVLEREAASLRTKYERLSASQRSLTANAGVVKPRSTLLGGRGLGAAAPRVEKSSYQKVKDSVAAVLTPQRTQVLTSFAIFVGSVALFHFQGDNLLA